MHAHVHAGVGAAVFGGSGSPRTGHHDGTGRDAAILPKVRVGLDGCLAHADVISMDDGETVGIGKTEFLENGVGVH